MTKRALFQFLFVFLLLAGQQSALVHSVWHISNHAPARGQGDQARAAQDRQDDGQSSQSRLCKLHAALGNLITGDCSGPSAAAIATVSHWVAPHTAAWRVAQPTATPPSRAPPVLL